MIMDNNRLLMCHEFCTISANAVLSDFICQSCNEVVHVIHLKLFFLESTYFRTIQLELHYFIAFSFSFNIS